MATIWIVEDEERIGLLILAAVKKAGQDVYKRQCVPRSTMRPSWITKI